MLTLDNWIYLLTSLSALLTLTAPAFFFLILDFGRGTESWSALSDCRNLEMSSKRWVTRPNFSRVDFTSSSPIDWHSCPR